MRTCRPTSHPHGPHPRSCGRSTLSGRPRSRGGSRCRRCLLLGRRSSSRDRRDRGGRPVAGMCGRSQFGGAAHGGVARRATGLERQPSGCRCRRGDGEGGGARRGREGEQNGEAEAAMRVHGAGGGMTNAVRAPAHHSAPPMTGTGAENDMVEGVWRCFLSGPGRESLAGFVFTRGHRVKLNADEYGQR